MPRILCHMEGLEFEVGPSWDGACPSCGEGFVEIIDRPLPNATVSMQSATGSVAWRGCVVFALTCDPCSPRTCRGSDRDRSEFKHLRCQWAEAPYE